MRRLMVARGGIEPPTRGFSDWLAYLCELMSVTDIARLKRCREWLVLELSRFTPTRFHSGFEFYCLILSMIFHDVKLFE